jgi:hypothetical protein
MRIKDWNPSKGDLLQGDVILFRIPDDIKIDTSDEVAPRDHKLILAEGEVTGHHHAIWLPQPTMFRDDGIVRELEAGAITPAVITKLYRDPAALEKLVSAGQLVHGRIAIGFLVIEGAPAVLRHDEHDGVRIPSGRYYVGGQVEWDAAEERRVQD